MYNYEIKSKVYSPPKRKESIIAIIVNCAIVIFALFNILSMILNGISINNVSGCILCIVFGFGSRAMFREGNNYIFCVIKITLDENLITISYYPYLSRKVFMPLDNIETLEYSDKLKCLRIIGDYTLEEASKQRRTVSKELLLYIEYAENEEFYKNIEALSHRKISFVDRL